METTSTAPETHAEAAMSSPQRVADDNGRSEVNSQAPETMRLWWGGADHWTILCVWSCWFMLATAALAFVLHYARNVPFFDEFWSIVPALTHEQPVTLSWLWLPNNEHHIPIPKLIQIGLAMLSGTDFRAGMVFNVISMTILAAVLMVTAMRLRGCCSYTDVFFPLALLHWGNYENLLWSFQVAFSVSTMLTVALLILIIRCREGLSAKQALAVGICLVMLPLCGAQGTVFVPPFALWVLYDEICHIGRDGWQTRRLLLRLALPALACALVACYYLVGYQASAQSTNGLKAARTALEFVAAGLGPMIRLSWPHIHVIVVALVVVTLFALARAWNLRPAARYGVVGMFLFIGAMLALAVGIGKGRAHFGITAGSSPRYAWLAFPLLCWIYLAASRYGSLSFARLIQGCLLLCAIFLAKENFQAGQLWAREHRELMCSIEEAARNDVPCVRIAGTQQALQAFGPADSSHNLELLRDQGMGPYRGLPRREAGRASNRRESDLSKP